MRLYSYFRSSAVYRVRIALNLKRLPFETIPVHLLKNGGEQFAPAYRKLNPGAVVPTLIDDAVSNAALTQSLAIIEYLEEMYPAPSLLPQAAVDRAFVRSIALSIACEIHPLNNTRVLRYLKHELRIEDADKDAWYRHWCEQGLASIEAMLSNDARVGQFCYGDSPTLADCFLAPQVLNAQRLNCDLSMMPTVMKINTACLALDAFVMAAPDKQPDTE